MRRSNEQLKCAALCNIVRKYQAVDVIAEDLSLTKALVSDPTQELANQDE